MSFVQTYYKILIKLQLLAISLPFFCFYLKYFSSWIRIINADPDPVGKMNADPCGSGSTALIWIGQNSADPTGIYSILVAVSHYAGLIFKKERIFCHGFQGVRRELHLPNGGHEDQTDGQEKR